MLMLWIDLIMLSFLSQSLVKMVGSKDEVLQEAAAGSLANIRKLALANEKAKYHWELSFCFMIPSFTKICKYFLHIRFNPFRTQEMRFFEKKIPNIFYDVSRSF